MTTTTAVTMYSLSLYPAIDTTIYVERFEPVRELIATDEHSEAGGKGANVSAALGEMGIACPCIALVGRENAEIYLKKLRSIGVQYIPLFAEGRIRENLSLETPAGQFRIMRRGFAADAGTLPQLERVLAAVLSPGDLVFVGGTLPEGIGSAQLAGICEEIRRLQAKVVLDTASVLPEDLPRIAPVLMKPNRHELEALTGLPVGDLEECLAAGQKLLAAGVESLLISLDADGAVYLDGERRLYAAAPAVEVRSTVGAGDSMLARFVGCRSRGMMLEEALRHAVAAGSAACTYYGTKAPNNALVERLSGQVEVRELSHRS